MALLRSRSIKDPEVKAIYRIFIAVWYPYLLPVYDAADVADDEEDLLVCCMSV